MEFENCIISQVIALTHVSYSQTVFSPANEIL